MPYKKNYAKHTIAKRFFPLKEITAYELAFIVRNVISVDKCMFTERQWSTIDDCIKRHFEDYMEIT
jgi:hypothetical protein